MSEMSVSETGVSETSVSDIGISKIGLRDTRIIKNLNFNCRLRCRISKGIDVDS